MNPIFIEVINADDQLSCLVNVNCIDMAIRTAGTTCKLYIANHAQPLESLTDYEEVLSLIESATSRPIAKA